MYGCVCVLSLLLPVVRDSEMESACVVYRDVTSYSGGYSGGVPPLPIPNREVKPARADGTAKVGE